MINQYRNLEILKRKIKRGNDILEETILVQSSKDIKKMKDILFPF